MYKVTEQTWPEPLIRKALKSAYEVTSVFHNSPAHQARIKPGWKILQINNFDELDEDAIDQARMHGITQMVFLEPKAGNRVTLLVGQTWPNGMVVVPCISDRLRAEVARKRIDSMKLDRIWGEGAWRQFATLKDPLLTALQPLPKRLLPRALAGDRLAAAMRSSEYLLQTYLALAYLAEGDLETAEGLWNRAVDGYNAVLRPHPSSFYALLDFIKSHVDYHTGRVEDAKHRIGNAVDAAPEIYLISQAHAHICRKRPVMRWSQWMQKRFPVEYDFPCEDPLGIFERPGERASLASALSSMRAGQLHIVYAMGPYRRNRPFFRELTGLVSLHRMAPERIASAHVICGPVDEDKLWKGFDTWERAALNSGLDIRLCSDAEDRVMTEMDLHSCPSIFILDREGIVLSVDYLDQEKGYWTAVDRMSDPAFQAEATKLREKEGGALSPDA